MSLYKVAEHIFEVKFNTSANAEKSEPVLLENYSPFKLEYQKAKPVFSLEIFSEAFPKETTEETRQVDEGQEIICGKTLDGNFTFSFFCDKRHTGTLLCNTDFNKGQLYFPQTSESIKLQAFALNNSLMVLYALATANMQTALFHSAVIKNNGKGYMFLGKSGTGKSTHARLWLKHIEGSELLNDDNPVVRVTEDGIRVYGSPWSGKTPCHKNESVALAGIVDLSQAPYNKIEQLHGIKAYLPLLYSISGMRWNKTLADGLHQTQNTLAGNIPVWHLDCLPDEDAARLCFENIKG